MLGSHHFFAGRLSSFCFGFCFCSLVFRSPAIFLQFQLSSAFAARRVRTITYHSRWCPFARFCFVLFLLASLVVCVRARVCAYEWVCVLLSWIRFASRCGIDDLFSLLLKFTNNGFRNQFRWSLLSIYSCALCAHIECAQYARVCTYFCIYTFSILEKFVVFFFVFDRPLFILVFSVRVVRCCDLKWFAALGVWLYFNLGADDTREGVCAWARVRSPFEARSNRDDIFCGARNCTGKTNGFICWRIWKLFLISFLGTWQQKCDFANEIFPFEQKHLEFVFIRRLSSWFDGRACGRLVSIASQCTSVQFIKEQLTMANAIV